MDGEVEDDDDAGGGMKKPDRTDSILRQCFKMFLAIRTTNKI